MDNTTRVTWVHAHRWIGEIQFTLLRRVEFDRTVLWIEMADFPFFYFGMY
jgi:hypothetical protein